MRRACTHLAYGQTKLLGEQYVERFCRRHFIVRTAWLYSAYGKNFVKTMVRLGQTHDKITVVNDQLGNPTNAVDLAYHILKLAVSHDYGIYHCTGNGICSWYDFACAIMQGAGLNCKVEPVTSAEYAAATRPAPTARHGARSKTVCCAARSAMRCATGRTPSRTFCKLEWRTLIYEDLSRNRLCRLYRL